MNFVETRIDMSVPDATPPRMPSVPAADPPDPPPKGTLPAVPPGTLSRWSTEAPLPPPRVSATISQLPAFLEPPAFLAPPVDPAPLPEVVSTFGRVVPRSTSHAIPPFIPSPDAKRGSARAGTAVLTPGQARGGELAGRKPVASTDAGDPEEESGDPDEPDPFTRLIDAAPSWLASLLVHLFILVLLATLYYSRERKEYVDLEAIFASRIGDQLDDDTLDLATMDDTNAKEPEYSPDAMTPVEDPFAAPPEMEVTLDPGLLSSTITAPEIGQALRGRDEGMKQALLKSFGGTAKTEASVQMALEWLRRNQQSNGSWSLKGPYADGSQTEDRTAATAMALLAFQGTGNTHQRGEFKECVAKGSMFLRKLQDDDGNFYHEGVRSHRAYAQAMATMSICELFAMTRDPAIQDAAQKAVDFAVEIQSPQGGWRYDPKSDSDTSVTGWYLMALQSARMAGLEVPSPVFEAISSFLDSVAAYGGARYSYVPEQMEKVSMTAEGLLCRQYLGWRREDPRLQEGVKFLLMNPIDWNERDTYYWYYGTQVMHHVGGDPWYEWNQVMRDVLPQHQEQIGKERGSWTNRGDQWGLYGGRLFSTCLSTYMLEVYYRHMPLYHHVYRDTDK